MTARYARPWRTWRFRVSVVAGRPGSWGDAYAYFATSVRVLAAAALRHRLSSGGLGTLGRDAERGRRRRLGDGARRRAGRAEHRRRLGRTGRFFRAELEYGCRWD